MLKLLLPLAFAGVAIGAVVWALMPADAPVRSRSAAQGTDTEGQEGASAKKAAPRGRAQSAAKRPPAPTVHNSARRPAFAGGKDVTARVRPGATKRGGSQGAGGADPAAAAGGAQADTDRASEHGTPQMPRIDTSTLKGSVRTYYSTLPKSGRMPARILAEEVLPMAVLETANVPAGSVLTMLGTWHTDRIDGFEEALALPDTGEGIIGFTVRRPDGTTHRAYIQTHE